MRFTVTISGVLLATAILVSANKYLPNISIIITRNEFTNGLLKYQILAFLTAVLSLIATVVFTPESRSLLKFGNTSIIAGKEKWVGINGKSSWTTNGLQLSFFISIATGIFMFLAVKYTNNLHNFKWAFIPFVLFFSVTNSFSEEIIYRFAINGNLTNYAPKATVLIISALLFGLPHYLGFPSGIIGVILSAVLGYIISKATFETQGIGIAWLIHFLQDVIIFTGLFMMNLKT